MNLLFTEKDLKEDVEDSLCSFLAETKNPALLNVVISDDVENEIFPVDGCVNISLSPDGGNSQIPPLSPRNIKEGSIIYAKNLQEATTIYGRIKNLVEEVFYLLPMDKYSAACNDNKSVTKRVYCVGTPATYLPPITYFSPFTNLFVGDSKEENIPGRVGEVKNLLGNLTFTVLPLKDSLSTPPFLASNEGEKSYLAIMQKIIASSIPRSTRNAVTKSIFGEQLKFDLTSFPLLTTKKMGLRPIFEELLFFLRGETDVSILDKKGVKIWNDNTTAEFIKKSGLKLEKWDMGPMYGFQFRHYGAEYKDCKYSVKSPAKDMDSKQTIPFSSMGLDQLADVIHLLKTDPYSRRIMMTSFNPVDAKNSVLYPCHGNTIQFYVNDKDKLCCHMYQRSADIFLGLPFNIASYALFTYLLVEVINNDAKSKIKVSPGELIISLGDVHIYRSHMAAVEEQLQRVPRQFPQLTFKKKITDITDVQWEDIVLTNYFPHPAIAAKMVA